MLKTVEEEIAKGRYPQWIGDMVDETREAAMAVAHHEAWNRLSDATISEDKHHALLIGFWPLIERFPQYLALNLLKCSFGADPVMNAARGWLIKNLRVEQRHAEFYRDWAEAVGVSRDRLYEEMRPAATTAITDWSWHICESGKLAEAMAATNFAIEGITGEWTMKVWESPDYKLFFKDHERKKAMRWIESHAAYDDLHPVESLDIIRDLLGPNPTEKEVKDIKNAVRKSYELYRLALDTGMDINTRRIAA